ncbi:hypothetical protein [Bacillus thuringiensis]|uniref:hypothetical protein n=1 Tax=Bacillus thuringiensis TaxID=1428 RepID=UPI000BF6F046|nr:hypothetical protein [Bacillus thuringiensis]PFR39989.1 hypothetical protein COK27_16750 [Bacillus thuringiensis]PGL20188.1 hypothetical protein CN921_24195 [Bacillus thuringiensis]
MVKEIVLLEEIEKHGNGYFNCFSWKIVSYLHSCNYPINRLFYRAYEHPLKIYNHCVVHRYEPWEYNDDVVSNENLQSFGITYKSIKNHTFIDVFNLIKDRINSGEIIFINLDSFYLHHRKKEFKQEHLTHWGIVSGYKCTSNNKVSFKIIDDQSNAIGNFIAHEYDYETLEVAYNKSNKLAGYLVYEQIKSANAEVILTHAKEYFMQLEDSFDIYNKLTSLLVEDINLNKSENRFRNISDFFSVISFSRFLLYMFLKEYNILIGVQQELKELSEKTKLLRNLFLKGSYTNTLNINNCILKIDEVARLDKQIFESIKSYFKNL